MLLLQCRQWGLTPLGLAEMASKEEAAGVLRRHGAKSNAELQEQLQQSYNRVATELQQLWGAEP